MPKKRGGGSSQNEESMWASDDQEAAVISRGLTPSGLPWMSPPSPAAPAPVPGPEDFTPSEGSAAQATAAAMPERVNWNDPDDVKAYILAKAKEYGVDVDNEIVQLTLGSLPSEMDEQMANGIVLGFVQNPALRTVDSTAYGQALEASGFSPEFLAEAPRQGQPQSPFGGLYGPSIAEKTGVQPKSETHPETGWVRYRNGVLVDPESGNVYFEPNSKAPGSPTYIRAALSWSDEAKQTWRQKLVDMGYLAEGDKSDESFANALRAYHTNRYAYGRPITSNYASTTGSEAEITLTAKDFQAQIRNDVREQFRSLYGEDPTDAELQQWSQFITRKSIAIQKALVGKGVDPGTALGTATTEAEELFVEKVENTPEAEALENTRLRDSLTEAVYITRGLGA